MKARPKSADTSLVTRTSTARGFDSQGDALPESEISANDLPPNWRWVRVREIGEVQLGRQRAPKHQNGKHMRPYLRVANVFEDRLDLSDVLTMNFTPREFESFALRANDILLNEGQSLHMVGRPALYRDELPGACFQNTLVRFRPGPEVDPRFALTIFRGYMHTGKFQKIARWTTNIAHLGSQRFAEMPFPLPHLPEQRRIVAEIEKQLTRLEAGAAALRRVQANLKRYRAAVRKAACEGRLVPAEAELAKTGKTKSIFESGNALLARILTERRKNWQGRGNYKEPNAPDVSESPPLPDGWTCATIEQLSTRVQYGSSAKTNEDASGVPVLRMGNIQDGRLDLTKLKYLPRAHDEFPELLLAKNDLLFNRTNSAELVGKTCVFKGIPCPSSFASYLIRVRFESGCNPDFVSYYVNSVLGRAWVAGVVSQQVGQANVNGTKLQALVIPLPPLAEQTRIVAEVERRLSVVEELEAVVAANLQRATRLRQSILQKAFTGELLQ